MNFGARLPGPFRVGMSSSGRMSAGVTVGPFSASTGVGRSRSAREADLPFCPIGLDQAVTELVADGWTPTYLGEQTAFVRKGWRAARIDAVADGVTWEPIMPRRVVVLKVALMIGGVLGVLALCGAFR